MTCDEKHAKNTIPSMSAIEFARLGGGDFAYIRQLDEKTARTLFPALPGLPEGIDLYVLVGADGTPHSISDSLGSAVANAYERDLEPVSVH